jgi:N-acetylglucosamine-6-sulfatase
MIARQDADRLIGPTAIESIKSERRRASSARLRGRRMTRYGYVARNAVVVSAAAVALLLALPSGCPAALIRPNIILIVTDDQDHSRQTISKMPYLRSRDPAYGGGWYRFDNAFINNPTCCPSRATILTGQWSHHTGVEVTEGAPSFDDSDTIATRLDAAGYRTGFIGKYHLGAAGPIASTYIPPGWDEFVDHKADTRAYYNYTLNDNGTLVNYGSNPNDYSTDVLAAKALHFINRVQPFFLEFAPRAPHNSWIPPPRYVGHYSREPVSFPPSWNEDTSDKPAWWANRPPVKADNRSGPMRKEWETLLAVDDAIEEIQKKVQNLGLLRNTVILFMTDNGYSFGEHRWGPKRCVYDSCAQTPLYVKYGGASGGWTFPQLVGNEDLAATLADLGGVAPPADGDGQSFAPMVESHTVPSGWDNQQLLRSANPNRDPEEPPDAWAVRTSRYMYAETTVTGEKELYDLRADPYELTNVAGSRTYAVVQMNMAARLAKLVCGNPQGDVRTCPH